MYAIPKPLSMKQQLAGWHTVKINQPDVITTIVNLDKDYDHHYRYVQDAINKPTQN